MAKNVSPTSRMIYIRGEFREKLSRTTIKKLLKYEYDDPTKDIIIYIDSFGGSVDSFIAIHDIIQMSRCDVATVCAGKCMSAACMLLMSGTKGKRFITPNSRVLLHEVSGCVEEMEKLAYLKNEVEEVERLNKLLLKLCTKYTDLTTKKARQLFSKDTYMIAKEALEFGIVDHIITKRNILWDNIDVGSEDK